MSLISYAKGSSYKPLESLLKMDCSPLSIAAVFVFIPSKIPKEAIILAL